MAWGKWRDDKTFHRLEHHCADVAACLEALLDQPVIHRRLASFAGCEEFDAATIGRLCALGFLHDFGKLNTGFQHKVLNDSVFVGRRPQPAGHIAEAMAVLVEDPGVQAPPHYAHAVRCALKLDELAEWGDSVSALLLAALAHHGRPADPGYMMHRDAVRRSWMPYRGYNPAVAAAEFGARLRQWYPQAFKQRSPTLPSTPAFQHAFAGLVALADWIGSNETWFRFEHSKRDDYVDAARSHATRAVSEIGLAVERRRAMSAAPEFTRLFLHVSPNAVQRAVAAAPLDERLLILESETGSGKTEAALLRYAALFKAGLVDGLYFAVPTRSAAMQLHRRVNAATQRLFPSDDPYEAVLAVPGYLRAGDVEGHPGPRWEAFWDDRPDDRDLARRWAAESTRRFLAAQVAVGTVDQAMMAGLMVKHAHARAAALARSLLVIDEVHASDAYMRRVLGRVLEHHFSAGGYALLMSATLGSASRARWLSGSREAPPLDEAVTVPYPALWGRGNSTPVLHALAGGGYEKCVAMTSASDIEIPEAIAARAQAAVRSGARVLVIRNTVDAAIATAQALEAIGGEMVPMLQVGGAATLHHGRFAAEDRRALDREVEQAMGREARAAGLVVVGTQTLEQSLDIDADFLITDLCPLDVLLQRLGRLHRHRRDDRPAGFADPQCVVLTPSEGLSPDRSLLRFGLGPDRDGGGVYPDLRILEVTRRLIELEPLWRIPAMNRALVERATHPEALAALEDELGEAWAGIGRLVEGRAIGDSQTGQGHSLDWSVNFLDLRFPDAEERIRTRLGGDGAVVKFADEPVGPFGLRVSRIVLPPHLSVSLTGVDVSGVMAEPFEGGFRFSCGRRSFRYDRFGLTKI